MTRKNRTRKLTVEQRILIRKLYRETEITMVDLGSRFGISQPRVSQIINDVYGEFGVVE
jgi:DNA-binding MarR family transcriptional regulator